MIPIKNPTGFETDSFIQLDKEGYENIVLMIKGTFHITPQVKIADQQVTFNQADAYFGDPDNSSLKYPSDFVLKKTGTDILMHGHAYMLPPAEEKTAPPEEGFIKINIKNNKWQLGTSVVSLKVGAYEKKIQVFGDRQYQRRILFHRIQKPALFEKIPLIYENAFGGSDTKKNKDQQKEVENRNPVGKGLRTKRGKKSLDGLLLPNLEDIKNPIKKWKSRPMPVCFGPIDSAWSPRIDYAGTYDEVWQKKRAPFLPDDFDYRFNNAAHPDLITRDYLTGGENVNLVNVVPQGKLDFSLPKISFEITFFIENKMIVKIPVMDTLTLEPDENQFTMIWRAFYPCGRKISQIRLAEITVLESNLDLINDTSPNSADGK